MSIGLVGSVLVAWLGHRRASLSQSGVVGTILVGTAVFGFGGGGWWILLIAFFASSSTLSHFRSPRKNALVEKAYKGARRDIWQVLANGGLAALLALVYAIEPSTWPGIVFAGSLAAVNADTWATELGVLGSGRPRLVTTGRPVEPGTNGAVSLIGTTAALAGALFIAVLAVAPAIFQGSYQATISLFIAVSLGGFCGSFFDSLLGASVQRTFCCDHCRQETERRVHSCGRRTRLVRGWPWLNNDGVNFLCAGAGGLAAVLLWTLLA